MGSTLGLAGDGCAKVEPLLGFVCSDSHGAILAADVVRWTCLVFGLLVGAAYFRLYRDPRARRACGLTYRLLGACTAAAYIAVTEWDRMHDPITLRLPLGLVALVALTVGAWKYQPPARAEDDMEARLVQLERFQQSRQNTP